MTQRILIMGLPGSGKSVLSGYLKNVLFNAGKTVALFDADSVRKQFNDWDFSVEGRIRQSERMRTLSDECGKDYSICNFVAPLEIMREKFSADWTVYMTAVGDKQYADTNTMFQTPKKYDFYITERYGEKWASYISDYILNNIRRPVFDWKKETVQMLGRWQPWHAGHHALFERLLGRTGQVIIQIRDTHGISDSNPFGAENVARLIRDDLEPIYQGRYEVQVVPNIVHIGWGRNVGYTAGEEKFDEEINSISGTKIRNRLLDNSSVM